MQRPRVTSCAPIRFDRLDRCPIRSRPKPGRQSPSPGRSHPCPDYGRREVVSNDFIGLVSPAGLRRSWIYEIAQRGASSKPRSPQDNDPIHAAIAARRGRGLLQSRPRARHRSRRGMGWATACRVRDGPGRQAICKNAVILRARRWHPVDFRPCHVRRNRG
jgi:hypothetical protein